DANDPARLAGFIVRAARAATRLRRTVGVAARDDRGLRRANRAAVDRRAARATSWSARTLVGVLRDDALFRPRRMAVERSGDPHLRRVRGDLLARRVRDRVDPAQSDATNAKRRAARRR